MFSSAKLTSSLLTDQLVKSSSWVKVRTRFNKLDNCFVLKISNGYSTGRSPTNHFTIFELQDQEIGGFYLAQGRRAMDFEAP